MSILCALGRHTARPMARWNGGYYFSTCSGCGRDLIRTPFERWHPVPAGFRVVWSSTPPPRLRTAALEALPSAVTETAQEHAASVAEETARLNEPSPREIDGAARDGDLPISEVLRLLREDETGTEPDTFDSGRQAADGPRAFDDFMNEDAAFWNAPDLGTAETEDEAAHGVATSEERAVNLAEPEGHPPASEMPAPQADATTLAAAAPAADREGADSESPNIAPGREANDAEEEPPFPERQTDAPELPATSELAAMADPQPAAAASVDFAPSGGVAPQPEWEDEPAPAPERTAWPSAAPSPDRARIVAMEGDRADWFPVLLVVAFGLLLVGAAIYLALRRPHAEGRAISPAVAASKSPQAATSLPAVAGQPAYVTVRLLSCRASPVLQSRTRRVLARGEEVQVIAREPGWASVTKDGRQCWAVDRYISSVRPI